MPELVLSALTILFVTVGPIEVATVFLAVSPKVKPEARTRVAFLATLVATIVLLAFALGGNQVLELMGVGLPAFRTAGGILLLKLAADLLFVHHSQLTSLSEAEEDEASWHTSIAIFPLALPMIAGPGSITAVVLLMGRATSLPEHAIVLGGLLLIAALTFGAMAWATQLVRFLGLTGANVIARLSGMLLAALAMQFVFDGLRESGLFSVLGTP
jgi:multiple antibiotic resistance protein